jgi:hypothetical protein
MNEEIDWVMRPVLEGLCRYESLKDCTLDLNDIARMNEALDVRAHNKNLVEEAHYRQQEANRR